MAEDEKLSSAGYEELTKSLVESLSTRSPVTTTRLQRNVVLKGPATENQIDVLWEFTAADGPHRILLECKQYKRTLEQGIIHAFRSVVDDLDDPTLPCRGVMVTETGYQRGAKNIASTYGIIILELRRPTHADLENRITSVRVSMRPRLPRIEELQLHVDQSADIAEGRQLGVGSDLEIQEEGKERRLLLELLLEGELNDISDQPTPLHPVKITFDRPTQLFIEGSRVGTIHSVAAMVGEHEGDPVDFSVGGLEKLCWMVKNTLGGARAWFMDDGQLFITAE